MKTKIITYHDLNTMQREVGKLCAQGWTLAGPVQHGLTTITGDTRSYADQYTATLIKTESESTDE